MVIGQAGVAVDGFGAEVRDQKEGRQIEEIYMGDS